MTLTPLGEQVIIKALERGGLTKGGLYLPDTVTEKPQEGEAQGVGPGRILDNGHRGAMALKAGDRAVFAKYGGTEFKMDGQDVLILRETDILAVLD